MRFAIEYSNQLAIVKLQTRKIEASDLAEFQLLVNKCIREGMGAILFDFSRVKSISYSGIATLLELTSSVMSSLHRPQLGFCSLSTSARSKIEKAKLADWLPCFKSLEHALCDPIFRKERLRGTRAILLSAGKGTRLAPLTESTPKPLLDLLGKPVLEHIIDYLGEFGIRDIIINPGHLGPQFPAHFNSRKDLSIFYLNEGHQSHGNWVATPIGSASTLARLHHHHNMSSDHTIVMCGDAIIDIDLAEMMKHHTQSEADVTIAAQTVSPESVEKYGIIETDNSGRVLTFQEKPLKSTARSTLANTGIYVFSPRVLSQLVDSLGQDIASNLLPSLLESGGNLQVFSPKFQWVDIGCGRDYFTAVKLGLCQKLSGVYPNGIEVRPGVWQAKGAKVSPLARIKGPCFIGQEVQIKADANIVGPSVIGAGTLLSSNSLIKNSIIFPDTWVQSGAIVDGMIASGNWAVDHQFADGSQQNRANLEFVTPREIPASKASTEVVKLDKSA